MSTTGISSGLTHSTVGYPKGQRVLQKHHVTEVKREVMTDVGSYLAAACLAASAAATAAL